MIRTPVYIGVGSDPDCKDKAAKLLALAWQDNYLPLFPEMYMAVFDISPEEQVHLRRQLLSMCTLAIFASPPLPEEESEMKMRNIFRVVDPGTGRGEQP